MAMHRDAKNRIEPEEHCQCDHEKNENDGYGSANMAPELIIKLPDLFEFYIPPQEWRNEHESKKQRERIAQGVITYDSRY